MKDLKSLRTLFIFICFFFSSLHQAESKSSSKIFNDELVNQTVKELIIKLKSSSQKNMVSLMEDFLNSGVPKIGKKKVLGISPVFTGDLRGNYFHYSKDKYSVLAKGSNGSWQYYPVIKADDANEVKEIKSYLKSIKRNKRDTSLGLHNYLLYLVKKKKYINFKKLDSSLYLFSKKYGMIYVRQSRKRLYVFNYKAVPESEELSKSKCRKLVSGYIFSYYDLDDVEATF